MRSKRNRRNNSSYSSSSTTVNSRTKTQSRLTYFVICLTLFVLFSFLAHSKKQNIDPKSNESIHGYHSSESCGNSPCYQRQQQHSNRFNDIISIEDTYDDISTKASSRGLTGSAGFRYHHQQAAINKESGYPLSTTTNKGILDLQTANTINIQKRMCKSVSPNSQDVVCTDITSEQRSIESPPPPVQKKIVFTSDVKNNNNNNNINNNNNYVDKAPNHPNANPGKVTTIQIPKEIIDENPDGQLRIEVRRRNKYGESEGPPQIIKIDQKQIKRIQQINNNVHMHVNNDFIQKYLDDIQDNDDDLDCYEDDDDGVLDDVDDDDDDNDNEETLNEEEDGDVEGNSDDEDNDVDSSTDDINSQHQQPPFEVMDYDSLQTFQQPTPNQSFSTTGNYNAQDDKNHEQKLSGHPRYFASASLPPERVLEESTYYHQNGKKWSQRVILEMLYHQILGTNVYNPREVQKILMSEQNEINNGITSARKLGIVHHPRTNLPLTFRKDFKLRGWTDTNIDVCQWEGIYCASSVKRNDTDHDWKRRRYSSRYVSEEVNIMLDYVGKNCFCVDPNMPLLSQYYNIDDIDTFREQNSINVDDGEKCQCRDGLSITRIPPKGAVTEITLEGYDFIGGELPAELGTLPFLKRLIIKNCVFIGELPAEFGKFQNLNEIYFENVDFKGGEIPSSLGMLNRTLENLTLKECKLGGTIPEAMMRLTNLKQLDLGGNELVNSVPNYLSKLKQLEVLDLSYNQLTGTIAPLLGVLTNMKVLNLAYNQLEGTICKELYKLSSLVSVNLEQNWFMGSFQYSLDVLKDLKVFKLGQNKLTGNLPQDGWDSFENFDLHDNMITGTIPQGIFTPRLHELDLSQNFFAGTISTLNKAKNLKGLMIQGNMLHGDVSFLKSLGANAKFYIEKNKFTGVIDQSRCKSLNEPRYPVTFNCTDFIACSPGTFHPEGVASEISGCVKCPSCSNSSAASQCSYIGQTSCIDGSTGFIRGDMNGDGRLSQREVLRLLYVTTGGHYWGPHYSNWGNMDIDECTLPGINCKGGRVTKIDLRTAFLCSSKPCGGIPSEIGLFSDSLEILDLSGSFHSMTAIDIPSTIGMLTKLKVFDLSRNLVKTIPNEIGQMTSLQVLNLKECRYSGTFPPTLWDLEKLEKMNLNDNSFSEVQFPSEFGKLTNLRELFLSRTNIKGTIPSELGKLVHMKNLEFYGNSLQGTIPTSFENFTNLRRLDIFSNHLEGSIDFVTKMPHFEVIHLRSNKFTGTIPREIGQLHKLAWLDLAENELSGEIPSSLSKISSLKDLFLTNNYFIGPIPPSLCSKIDLNDGQAKDESCDHILCPIGTYSKEGFAKPSKGQVCLPCDENETSLHMGMTFCMKIGQFEYLTMLQALLEEEMWAFDNDDDDTNEESERSECDLDLVTCDADGNIIGLEIPLAGISFDDGLFKSYS